GRGLADRRGWWRLPFAEQGNADDADVIRTAGARSIGVWKRSEIERRRLAEVAPPALDVKPATRRKHVAALLRVGARPGALIDAIDRHYGHQVLALAVAHRDLIFVARLSDHVGTSVAPVHLKLLSFGAIEDRQIRKSAVREGIAGVKKDRCKQHSNRF